jgi:hydroxyacylglutathione hydrolase
MTLELVTIPCLSDNYAFLIREEESGRVALIDAPESGPIITELEARGWTLDEILLTHHHPDHIDGVPDLVAKYGSKITGAKADAHRLPALNQAVADGDTILFGGTVAHVLDVSGHTVGHIAFHFFDDNIVFSADSLMALGCGRLFEGDAAMMWASMQKFIAMPDQTVVCSGHEYTTGNAAFALTIEPENAALQTRVAAIKAAREKGEFTVPSSLDEEKATNPFLRAHLPELQKAIGMEGADAADVFREVRTRKDNV